MPESIRVLIRWTGGSPFAQASQQVKDKAMERWYEVRDTWKEDPGIRFVCFYKSTGGSGPDGYGFYWVFEVDDAHKAREMAQGYPANEWGPFEKRSFEIVWGETEVDEYWAA